MYGSQYHATYASYTTTDNHTTASHSPYSSSPPTPDFFEHPELRDYSHSSASSSSLSSPILDFTYLDEPYVANSAFEHPRYLPQPKGDFVMPHFDPKLVDTYMQHAIPPPSMSGLLAEGSSLQRRLSYQPIVAGTSIAIRPVFAPYTSTQPGFVHPSESILPLEDLIDVASLAVPEPMAQPIPRISAKNRAEPSVQAKAKPRLSPTNSSKRSQPNSLSVPINVNSSNQGPVSNENGCFLSWQLDQAVKGGTSSASEASHVQIAPSNAKTPTLPTSAPQVSDNSSKKTARRGRAPKTKGEVTMRKYLGEENGHYYCTSCKNEFKVLSSFRRHWTSSCEMNENRVVFVCECGSSYNREQSLKRHCEKSGGKCDYAGRGNLKTEPASAFTPIGERRRRLPRRSKYPKRRRAMRKGIKSSL